MKQALTYDDIQLVPGYSEIKSRQNIKLHTLLSRRYGLLQPLVASPMDTVCGYVMFYKMAMIGVVGYHLYNANISVLKYINTKPNISVETTWKN